MNANRRNYRPSTPLASSALKVVITDLLAEYELRHTFSNEGDEAIEAVYSFPVPLDAAFVGMEATLAGETLSAHILPAKQASRKYDEALTNGDSAVLLEQVEPGMLCVNLGNLKPSEQGEIVLRFSAALNVADGTARFSLPLVHRPRYGRSRLDAIVEPTHDFAVEHPLEAELCIRGLLASRPVQCATQGARFAVEDGETVLRLDKAMLDRDLVLNIDMGEQVISDARLVEDGEGSIGIVTFNVPPSQSNAPSPRDICLLLDCSGSMAGDAIAQSRQALVAVTGALQEHDRIQIIRFGSSTEALFRRPLQATPRVKAALHEMMNIVEANLGGTDMDNALQEAMQSLHELDGDQHQKVVILVTDGAVQPHDIVKARKKAIQQGVRVFVVAVGSSAGADVLAPLATATGATLERAVPAEPIDAGVMRQFRRARSMPVSLDVDWGLGGVDVMPLPIAYPGDAVTAIAMFNNRKPRKVEVRIPTSAQKIGFALAEPKTAPGWRAWAGQQAYAQAPEDAKVREEIALRYGLIAPETKAVLVKVRAEGDKVDGLPIVTPVPHMTPAGMVVHSLACASYAAAPVHAKSIGVRHRLQVAFDDDCPMDDYLDIPAFMRKSGADSLTQKSMPPSLSSAAKTAFVEALVDLFSSGLDKVASDELLRKVDPAFQKEIRAWLEHRQMHFISRSDAGDLLRSLLDEGMTLKLDDSREAELTHLLAKARASS